LADCVEKILFADDRKISEPLVRLIRSDARDQIIHRKKCPLVLVSIFSSLAVAEFAHMRHLREFRSPAIFEFFNTIGAKPTFHRPLSDVSLRSRLGAVVWTPNDLMLIHLADELHETGAATRNVLMVSRISAVASLLDVLSPAETKRLGTLIRELLARQDTTELDRFTICRMCDDPVCTNCPLPTTKSKRDR